MRKSISLIAVFFLINVVYSTTFWFNSSQLNQTNFVFALNHSDCLNITDLNALICSPAFPKLNQLIQLSYGDCFKYQDSITYQLCLLAHPPLLNYSNYDYNFSCVAPALPKISLNKTLKAGEYYNNSLFDLNLGCEKDLVNKTIVLGNKQYFVLSDKLLNVSCYVEEKVCEKCVGGLNESEVNAIIENCSKKYSVSVENESKFVCLDRLSSLCSPQEVMTGDWYGCFTRNTNDMNLTIRQQKERIAYLEHEVSAWQVGEKIKEAYQKEWESQITFISAGIFLVLLFALFIYIWNRRVQKVQTIVFTDKTERKEGERK